MFCNVLIRFDILDLLVSHANRCAKNVQTVVGVVMRDFIAETVQVIWLVAKMTLLLYLLNSQEVFFVYQNF